MTGSAKILAKTKPRMPATTPDSAPRRIMRISMGTRLPRRSVAGEAEEVPRVVHPLVDHHALAEQRGHALVDADEVVDRQGDEHGDAEDQQHPLPGKRLGRHAGLGLAAGYGNAGHREASLGSCVPFVDRRRDGEVSDSPPAGAGGSQWRDRAGLSPASFAPPRNPDIRQIPRSSQDVNQS